MAEREAASNLPHRDWSLRGSLSPSQPLWPLHEQPSFPPPDLTRVERGLQAFLAALCPMLLSPPREREGREARILHSLPPSPLLRTLDQLHTP